MGSFEFNKIFAAVLCAGIVAMLGGFVSKKLVYPEKLKEDVVPIDGGAVEVAGGPKKAQLPEPILHLIATADVAKGEKLSKACAACHAFEKGGPHKVGPYMWGVVGKQVASKDGFSYSDALREHGGAWSYEELNAFLWKPKKYIPGTKMNYIGKKKPQDRADLIAWMATLHDNPPGPPSAAEIAAEKARFAPEEAAPTE